MTGCGAYCLICDGSSDPCDNSFSEQHEFRLVQRAVRGLSKTRSCGQCGLLCIAKSRICKATFNTPSIRLSVCWKTCVAIFISGADNPQFAANSLSSQRLTCQAYAPAKWKANVETYTRRNVIGRLLAETSLSPSPHQLTILLNKAIRDGPRRNGLGDLPRQIRIVNRAKGRQAYAEIRCAGSRISQ